jgi:acetolactate synthase small subunit
LSRHDVELTALAVDRVEGAPLRMLTIELDTSAARVERLRRQLTKMINVVEVRAA